MVKRFSIREGAVEGETYFDRQKLITWWDQERIACARVMVVGAGALGNETIKNLLLLGFRNLFICDFDQIETSNLSRTVLFGPRDIGKSKAHTAAERARNLCLTSDHRITSFHGDITSQLGLGVFQSVDIVLGCVDNVEARRFINRICRWLGKPWIDSGINVLAGHVSFYSPDSDVCYECVISDHQLQMARQRYSCDNVKRLHIEQARTPTVQITSSIISGLQVQECVKHLCGGTAVPGQLLWFDGVGNQFEIFGLLPREGCAVHASLGEVRDVPLSNHTTVLEALHDLGKLGFGVDPLIDTLGLRPFVTTADCRRCGRPIELYRPQHDLTEADLVCTGRHVEDEALPADVPVTKTVLGGYGADSEPRILDMSLSQLGVPPADILAVVDGDRCHYIRLAADLDLALAGNA